MTVNYDLGKKNYCITKYVTLFNTRRLVYGIKIKPASEHETYIFYKWYLGILGKIAFKNIYDQYAMNVSLIKESMTHNGIAILHLEYFPNRILPKVEKSN